MTAGRVVLLAAAALTGRAALRRAAQRLRVRRHRTVGPQRRYADYLTPPAPDTSGWFRCDTGDR